MSCWIVPNESINNLVNSFYWSNYLIEKSYFRKEFKEKFNIDLNKVTDDDLNKELKKLGQILVNLNNESFNQRYDIKDKPFIFKLTDAKSLNEFQFLKSLQCFLYQSCEGNNDKTELYKFLREYESFLSSTIINNIEEYKNAKWE